MFSIFWCRKGIITYDFCEKGTTINATYFSQLVAECKRKKRKSPNMPLWLLIDNAPVHSACISQETIAKCGFTSLRHPPYSPDIAPSDFYLFNYMKKHLRGHHFSTADDLKEAVVNYLSSLEESFFVAAFDDLVKRWKKLVANEGGYIEK
jgi:transposase